MSLNCIRKILIVVLIVLAVITVTYAVVAFPKKNILVSNTLASEINLDNYETFSEDRLKELQSDSKIVILFFYASWDPISRLAEEDFIKNISIKGEMHAITGQFVSNIDGKEINLNKLSKTTVIKRGMPAKGWMAKVAIASKYKIETLT